MPNTPIADIYIYDTENFLLSTKRSEGTEQVKPTLVDKNFVKNVFILVKYAIMICSFFLRAVPLLPNTYYGVSRPQNDDMNYMPSEDIEQVNTSTAT
jgi:hypothetical protein